MIGVFDSGFGGLTVLSELKKHLPEYNYIYLGDNARTPYGIRTKETVYEYTKQAVDFLFKQGSHLIIIACNTASVAALRKLQQEYLPQNYPDRRILGVVRPLVEKVAEQSNVRIGVVGTRSTIDSNVYETEIHKLNPDIEIFQQACPLLVSLVEEGWIKKKETKSIIRYYLKPLKKQKINKLILGCTHYPLLYNLFKKEIHRGCEVLNSGQIVALLLKDYLQRHPEIDQNLTKNSQIKYLTTDSVEKFERFASKIMKQGIKAEKVTLT